EDTAVVPAGPRQAPRSGAHAVTNRTEAGPHAEHLAALRSTGAIVLVPPHRVDVGPGRPARDELLEEQCSRDRSAGGDVGYVVEVGDGAVEVPAIGGVQRHAPQRIRLGLAGRE